MLLIVLLASAALVYGRLDQSVVTEDLRDLITTLHKSCTEKHKVSDDTIEKTNNGIFPNDPDLKCYMKCIMQEGGAMDENGLIDYEPIDQILPDKMKGPIKSMFEHCAAKVDGKDLCEKTFEFYKCCYDKDSKRHNNVHGTRKHAKTVPEKVTPGLNFFAGTVFYF